MSENLTLLALQSHLNLGLGSSDPETGRGRNGSSGAGRVRFDGMLRSFLNTGDSVRQSTRREDRVTSSSTDDIRPSQAIYEEYQFENDEIDEDGPGGDENNQRYLPETLADLVAMIWDLLHPFGDDGQGSLDAIDQATLLQRFQEAVSTGPGQESGLTSSALSLGPQAFEQGLPSANVSAELNNEAVLAELEQALAALSEQEVVDAVRQAASTVVDSPDDVFARLADALRIQSVTAEENTTAGPDLLDELGLQQTLDLESLAEPESETDTLLSNAEPVVDDGAENRDTELPGVSGDDWDAPNGTTEEPPSMDRTGQAATAEHAGRAKTANNPIASAHGSTEQVSEQTPAGGSQHQNGDASQNGNWQSFASYSPSEETPGASGGASTAADSGFAGLFDGTAHDGASAGVSLTAAPGAAAGSGVAGTAPTTMSSMLDQIRNIERIAEAAKMAQRSGIKNITIQMSPPELGKVTLRVESRGGIVSAFLRVEKAETAAHLSHNLQQLRDTLKAQGIEMGELEVRQHNEGGPAHGDHGHHRRRDEDGIDTGADEAGASAAENPDAEAEALPVAGSAEEGLNLIV